jgi:hypothetical protein
VCSELGLTPAEKALFGALSDLDIRYLVVGLSAALLEGAPVVTQDIDIWFGPSPPWDAIAEAAKRAGGFYTSGLSLQRPTIGGDGLDRIDVVLTAQGLRSFDDEYAASREYTLQGLRVRVLPLERVLASKRATARAKDLPVIPALEDALAARRARDAEGDPGARR